MSFTIDNLKKDLKRRILFNLVILLIFISWSSHSLMSLPAILPIIDLSLFTLAIFIIILALRKNLEFYDKIINLIFSLIAIFYLIDVIFLNDSLLFPLIIQYSELIGIQHNHNFLLFLVLLGFIILKISPVKLKFIKRKGFVNLNLEGGIFEFFTLENKKDVVGLLVISLPLAAFVEEFLYRSVFLSFFTVYLNWNIIFSTIVISIGFGLAHFTSSKNFLHVISASISSLIYIIALVELGLVYAWILHLSTNIIAIIFFYPEIKKLSKDHLIANQTEV